MIVSRETELGSSTLRFIDNQIDDMICNPSWGLIDSHVDTLRELVWDYLFDRNKKYRSLPKSVNEIKYSLVEERIDNLIGTMADIMNLIHGNLHERNFARALSRIWRVTIDLFIQFLLPTLDRAYPYLKKKDTWQFSTWDFDLGLRKKKKKSHGDLNLPEPKDRVKHVHYLNDVQVEMIRLAYDEIFSLLNCDGAKAGLKERKAKEQLGGDLLMLLEMWKAVDSVPELVMSETGTIASQMVIEEEKARKYGWDGTAGRRWRQLRDKKNHLYHLLLYAARIKHDKQAINFLESVLLIMTKKAVIFKIVIAPALSRRRHGNLGACTSHPGTWEHLLLKRPSLHCVVECARSYIQSLVLNLSMGHAFGYSPGKLKRICEVMKEKIGWFLD